MAEAAGLQGQLPPESVEIDPDFEPQKRPRSCTWPLPHPESRAGKPGTPIPEEEDDEEEDGPAGKEPAPAEAQGCHRGSAGAAPGAPPLAVAPCASTSAAQQLRKSSARRNAWGNYSYADLITQAIESAPDKRLTLSQIYDWMVRSVPYFKDKGDSNSSAGWKNSIRHNLSLHSRFVKVQNEGTGKSSWWMVNPEGGKGGKAPRRRAVSMDNSKYMKGARGRATKKKASLQASQDGSSESSSSLSKWTGSPSSDELDAWTDFRSRTNSSASTLSGRLSPILANLELDQAPDDDSPLSPMLYSSPSSASPSNGPAGPSGLSDLTGTMNLNDPLMDDLLDNISLTAAQQPPPGEEDSAPCAQAGSVFSFGPAPLFRPAPMQTIQENKQTSFRSAFAGHQDPLSLDPPGPNNVLLTQSDPLMSQASTAVALQNTRRNVLLLLRKEQLKPPALSGWQSCPLPPEPEPARQNHRPGRTPAAPPGPLLSGQDRLSVDLDLDVFGAGLECDMDAIIRNELMDADCLDLSFDARRGSGQNRNRNPGGFPGSKQSWVSS